MNMQYQYMLPQPIEQEIQNIYKELRILNERLIKLENMNKMKNEGMHII